MPSTRLRASATSRARILRLIGVPAGRPAEWETLLRLAAIVQGHGAAVDVAALDDALVAEDVRKLAGDQADAMLKAVAGRRGPERLLDLALRGGPFGDGFGRTPGGLSLDKVMAAPHGIDLGPLQPRIPGLLRTPSGCIELAQAALLEDLRRVAADVPAASVAAEGEALIIGRRQVRSNNSWMHNLPTLAKGPFRCTALVHPEDARRWGLADGGRARIARSARQAIEVQVELSDEMMPGVISLPHGWGHGQPGSRMAVAAQRPGANLNAVLDDALRDPLSGNAVLGGVAVRISPVMAEMAR